MTSIVFLTWAPYHRRPELLAQHLGGKSIFISCRGKGQILQLPFRYLAQGWKSWQVLRRERPGIVFVQNPPIFCVLVAFLYSGVYGTRYIIDSHTGAFSSRKWRWSVGLHRLLSRAALVTIVHNTRQESVVRGWGHPYMVIGYTPGSYPPGEPYPLDGQFNVAVSCSFHEDEPLALLFAAAALLPEVSFYITGDPTRAPQHLLSERPPNCCLTGYLSYDRYIGLLRGVDAVMALTTSDQTLLMGGFEAVSLGAPLIVSDWPLLREYFSSGAVYVANTVAGIRDGVCLTRREQAALQRGTVLLRAQLESEWAQKLSELRRRMGEQQADEAR